VVHGDDQAYWRWRRLPAVRSGRRKGWKEYDTSLAGKLVQSTLTRTLTFLRAQAQAEVNQRYGLR
jgi:hypothetical protein